MHKWLVPAVTAFFLLSTALFVAGIPVDKVLYHETAFRIIRKALAKGAGPHAFLSSDDTPEDEADLQRRLRTVTDDELRRRIQEAGISVYQ